MRYWPFVRGIHRSPAAVVVVVVVGLGVGWGGVGGLGVGLNVLATEISYLSNPGDAYIDGSVQERRNSSALPMELRLSCIKPSI